MNSRLSLPFKQGRDELGLKERLRNYSEDEIVSASALVELSKGNEPKTNLSGRPEDQHSSGVVDIGTKMEADDTASLDHSRESVTVNDHWRSRIALEPKQAIWKLDTWGETVFYNNESFCVFSRADVLEMRNQGYITENDFLSALGHYDPNAPEYRAALAGLDPMRPKVVAAPFPVPYRPELHPHSTGHHYIRAAVRRSQSGRGIRNEETEFDQHDSSGRF